MKTVYNPDITIIVLTLNEELHLPKFLDSVQPLQARTVIFDSGSSDLTRQICDTYQAEFVYHEFSNHPRQWHAALTQLKLSTPWLVCLDADQLVSPSLLKKLLAFKASDHQHIHGIYFNRKYYFQGKWIKHGGYYPKYLLKMFNRHYGHSDLQENMDHRFIVHGKTIRWDDGFLIEENLKENKISFWINKHNIYSDLLSEEEFERRLHLRKQSIKPNLLGTPDEKNAWQKNIWWQLPLYLRPFLYFIYRIIFRLGILDGRTGLIYHFLQSFWFRLLVDIKIHEKMRATAKTPALKAAPTNLPAITFSLRFLLFFGVFYGFNEAYIGWTSPGGLYFPVLDKYANYIKLWRQFNIHAVSYIIERLGYEVVNTAIGLRVAGRAGFILVYSCLGYGIMSLAAAFIVSFPRSGRSRLACLVITLAAIQVSNIFRLVLIALYAKRQPAMLIDHHTLYNILLYLLLSLIIYLWLKPPIQKQSSIAP